MYVARAHAVYLCLRLSLCVLCMWVTVRIMFCRNVLNTRMAPMRTIRCATHSTRPESNIYVCVSLSPALSLSFSRCRCPTEYLCMNGIASAPRAFHRRRV